MKVLIGNKERYQECSECMETLYLYYDQFSSTVNKFEKKNILCQYIVPSLKRM